MWNITYESLDGICQEYKGIKLKKRYEVLQINYFNLNITIYLQIDFQKCY